MQLQRNILRDKQKQKQKQNTFYHSMKLSL